MGTVEGQQNNPDNDPVIMIPQVEIPTSMLMLIETWFRMAEGDSVLCHMNCEAHIARRMLNGNIEFTDEVWHSAAEVPSEVLAGTYVTCIVVDPPDMLAETNRNHLKAMARLKRETGH